MRTGSAWAAVQMDARTTAVASVLNGRMTVLAFGARGSCAPSPRRGEGRGEGLCDSRWSEIPSPGSLRSPPSPLRGEGRNLPLRSRIGRAVLAHVAHALVVALGAHVDVGIIGGLARRAAADL